MIRKRFLRKIFVVVLLCATFSLCGGLVHHANAATCKTVTQAKNDSIYDACRWSGVRGTMWINDSSASTNVSSVVKVDGWENGDGKVGVYLHGAIIGGSSADGTHIKLIKGNSVIEGLSEANKHSAYAVFSNVPYSMSRPGNSRTGTIRSRVKKIYLNVKKMRELETPTKEGNGYEVYKIPIQGFRCYYKNGYTGGCYSSKSTLSVEVKLKEVKLTAVSIDTSGKSLSNVSGLENKVAKGYYGKNVKVTRGKNANYEFKGWKLTKTATSYVRTTNTKKARYVSGNASPKPTFHVKELTSNTKVYAVYKEKSVDEPDEAEDDLSIKVRNNNVDKYSEYMTDIYAKPTDEVEYKAVYTPTAQALYGTTADIIKVNGVTKSEGEGLVISDSSNTGFNWNNGFGVNGKLWNNAWAYAVGTTTARTVESERYTITNNHVGMALEEYAKTNYINAYRNISTAPKSVTVSALETDDGMKTVADIDISALESLANVYVPYNFETAAAVEDEDEIVYAGEEKSIQTTFEINDKHNTLTTNSSDETYVTKADDVVRELVAFKVDEDAQLEDEMEGEREMDLCGNLVNEADDCVISEIDTRNYNITEPLSVTERHRFTAPDVAAGSRVCVAMAVFPASSGADDNISTDYSNSWRLSDTACYTVAKRPSLQVWGGNIYSAGDIVTEIANKKAVRGYDEGAVFGSFGELGVIAGGSVTGLASGAALGYQSNLDGNLWPQYTFVGADGTPRSYRGDGNNAMDDGSGPGGSTRGNASRLFCLLSPLTMPNESCGSTSISNAIAGIKITDQNKTAILNKLIPSSEERSAAEVTVIDNLDDMMEYYYSVGDLTLDAATITSDLLKVVQADGDVVIKGNLRYGDSGYSTFSEMPALVIYAKNIYVDCKVDRIDALMVAEETVNTCVDSGNYAYGKPQTPERNSQKRSNQLTVYGAIIADKLEVGRTYGAATGANSIIPAEIVNFDPSLYVLAGNESEIEDAASGGLVMTYQHELAPRL